LVSPDRTAAPKFGQPLIKTSEPCGKRSLIGRFIATSVSAAAFVRAFRHDVKTDTPLQVGGKAPRRPLKPRGPY
jgi:hypothetical protein